MNILNKNTLIVIVAMAWLAAWLLFGKAIDTYEFRANFGGIARVVANDVPRLFGL